jgi:hypothetical protein
MRPPNDSDCSVPQVSPSHREACARRTLLRAWGFGSGRGGWGGVGWGVGALGAASPFMVRCLERPSSASRQPTGSQPSRIPRVRARQAEKAMYRRGRAPWAAITSRLVRQGLGPSSAAPFLGSNRGERQCRWPQVSVLLRRRRGTGGCVCRCERENIPLHRAMRAMCDNTGIRCVTGGSRCGACIGLARCDVFH